MQKIIILVIATFLVIVFIAVFFVSQKPSDPASTDTKKPQRVQVTPAVRESSANAQTMISAMYIFFQGSPSSLFLSLSPVCSER